MCTYLTVVAPRGASPEAFAALCAEHGFDFTTLRNPHVEAQLPAGARYGRLTRGHCDCGTPVGAGLAEASEVEGLTPRELAKLQRKGWSEAKVARYAADKATARDRRAVGAAPTPSLAQWLALLTAACDRGWSGLGLLRHEYGGSLEDERFDLRTREVGRAELSEALLAGLATDCLLRVR